jgi:hypothetical protein
MKRVKAMWYRHATPRNMRALLILASLVAVAIAGGAPGDGSGGGGG